MLLASLALHASLASPASSLVLPALLALPALVLLPALVALSALAALVLLHALVVLPAVDAPGILERLRPLLLLLIVVGAAALEVVPLEELVLELVPGRCAFAGPLAPPARAGSSRNARSWSLRTIRLSQRQAKSRRPG